MMAPNSDKENDIEKVVALLRGLDPVQVDIIESIIERFAAGCEGELVQKDFLNDEAYKFFGIRLSAHHAYSSSFLKKENFEHILEQSFNRVGVASKAPNSRTARGADLTVGTVTLSLKTEASQGLKKNEIVISKLMEAAWIKQIQSRDDIPEYLRTMVLPHFENYDRIFILRAYPDPDRNGCVRYDLREIPKAILQEIRNLTARSFSAPTAKRTTSADVRIGGFVAFKFRLDGSDDKITITNLDVRLCPLHAWWSLSNPG